MSCVTRAKLLCGRGRQVKVGGAQAPSAPSVPTPMYNVEVNHWQERHVGVMVTVPASGREGLGFKSHSGGFSSSHQVVFTGVEECHGGRSLLQRFTSTL